MSEWHFGGQGEMGHESTVCYKYPFCSYGPLFKTLEDIQVRLARIEKSIKEKS